jgi:hypothetical protein
VAKNFREIFAALAAGGKGELVMQKRLSGPAAPAPAAGLDAEGDAGDEQTEAGGVAEKYVGVKVKVRLVPQALQSAAVRSEVGAAACWA